MCTALDPDGEATLTSVRSQEENDFITVLGYNGWIGGTDQDEEGIWRCVYQIGVSSYGKAFT